MATTASPLTAGQSQSLSIDPSACDSDPFLVVTNEGTTSDGNGMLPFHANLLQAAISTQTPVQPVALRFSDSAERFSPAAAYVGAVQFYLSQA